MLTKIDLIVRLAEIKFLEKFTATETSLERIF